VTDDVLSDGALDAATDTLAVAEHPLLLTVTVYVPDARPVTTESVIVLLQVYVNGPVPLVTRACAEPLLFPQVVLTSVVDTEGPPVELTDTEAVAEHPPEFDTVTVYVPAARPRSVADVIAVPAFQWYVYVPVGVTLTVAVPLELPHVALTAVALALRPPLAPPTVNVLVVEQLCASVTVTVYEPAARLLAVAVVCCGVVLQRYEYVDVPPVVLAATLPELASEHETLVTVPETESAAGCVSVSVTVAVQLCASVTVTVYVPAVRPERGLPVRPPVHA
jgi:hypothetical protein